MRHLYHLLVLSLLTGSLVACVGGKPKPGPAVYDFGLASTAEKPAMLDVTVQVEEVTAAESLNSNHMRYRLNYQNPARVFSYTESRWAALPSELLSAKIRGASRLAGAANCSLKLQLEAFDQVFNSESDSLGIVRLSASLSNSRTQKTIAETQFEETAAAPTPDAKGGVIALNGTSSAAITKALNWANTTAEKSAVCH